MTIADVRKVKPCFGLINENYTRVCGLTCPYARPCTWVTMIYVYGIRD